MTCSETGLEGVEKILAGQKKSELAINNMLENIRKEGQNENRTSEKQDELAFLGKGEIWAGWAGK